MDKSVRLFTYASGIFICFLYYSIVQEKITRRIYGASREDQEVFTCYLTLVFLQCISNYFYANFLSATVMKQGENRTKTLYYWTCALTNLLAMVCSTMALRWISYPTQVIGKSGKPIPVMMLGVLLGNKAYPCYKFVFVFMVVFGVTLFMWNSEQHEYFDEHNPAAREGTRIGELLILLSLTMDGITAAIQERMRTEYMTKSLHMMSGINKWSIVFLGVALAYKGEMTDFIGFVSRHPSAVWEIISFSLAYTHGQLFIFLMIEHFGSLSCSLVTTTRKFFTVFVSVFIYGNRLMTRQWLATIIVFVGLFLDMVWKDLYNELVVNFCRTLRLRRIKSKKENYRDEWV